MRTRTTHISRDRILTIVRCNECSVILSDDAVGSSFPLFQRRATFSAESALPVRSRTLPAEQWTPDYDEIVPKTPAIRKTAAKTSAPIHQSFHPKPPDKPSDFSMWVGNLPKLVSQDELWIFFTQGAAALPHSISNTTSGLLSANTIYHGVLSIFLISKTNCAFVDYATEAHRNHATALFDGKPLRAGDARCPKLICRARRKEDELTAGVGAQVRFEVYISLSLVIDHACSAVVVYIVVGSLNSRCRLQIYHPPNGRNNLCHEPWCNALTSLLITQQERWQMLMVQKLVPKRRQHPVF